MRNKTFSIINILGLSIGLTVCMLIFLYAKDEMTFDAFHEKKNDLFQLTCKLTEKNGRARNLGVGGMPQGPIFKSEIPEIKEFVRIKSNEIIVVKNGNETFEEKVSMADENFFMVFSFPLIYGNPQTALTGIHSIVLTKEVAEKYFGTDNAVGKILELEMNNKFEPFLVTGVAKEPPQNSSIKFKMLLSMNYRVEKNDGNNTNWHGLGFPTFFVLNPNTDPNVLTKKMAKVYEAKSGVVEMRKRGEATTFQWSVQPLLQMHLNTNVENSPEVSNPVYSQILTGIAALILIIACINFVNLTVARSLKRSKEIGIRKVMGGRRSQLFIQFMGESLLMCSFAFALAFILTYLTLPFFNTLANKQLNFSYLLDNKLVLGFSVLLVITVFVAGFYPALVLSGADPVNTLYNRTVFAGKNYLSKALVIVQFSLATFFIITTIIIYKQFNYLTNKDLGYNEKDLLALNTGRGNDAQFIEALKNEFKANPGIESVAPEMSGEWITNSRANGKDIDVWYERIDEDYLETMQIKLLQGRNFSRDFSGDSTISVIVNEAYVKAAGWSGNVIGKTVDNINGQDRTLQIIGVIRDYHFESLKEKIKPQLLCIDPALGTGKFMIRLKPGPVNKTLAGIEKTYKKLFPYHPFKVKFIEEYNLKYYKAEKRWKDMIAFSAMITIFISCIGLFGLTMLSTQKRTKEIGIRKVLGAGVLQVSALVSKNFIPLIFISFIIAIPAAWYGANIWLQNFPYRIEISWKVFMTASLIITFIAIITISFHTIKTAIANPVKSLRTE